MENFIWRNQCNWVNGLWSIWVIMGSRSVELFNVNPFDTFITGESERDSCGTLNQARNIDPYMPVNCLS